LTLRTCHTTKPIPIGSDIASYALISIPVLARLTGTTIDVRIPRTAAIAGYTIESIPVLTSGARARIERA